ncbi:hypothetical protein AAFF_G00022890 [Aldrovandia affinis]|uniref:C-type lectin domain-containing protein n=1 Tax=Aldrovandia affinis TaxID=143900 RepID=A0AAD7T5K5_9TELE|nr:hypothetical protein AAFF_G00022890 [Aldrovandia affinis]
MDSNGYDQFNGPEQHLGQKIVLYRGKRITVAYILYGIVLFLLLILLLITGLKFAQLRQEVSDIKLLLISINSSLVGPVIKLSKAEAHISELFPIRHEHMVPEQGPCDEGWLFFQGSCYLLSTQTANWHTAEGKCDEQGAHLLVINNADEQDFISDVMIRSSYWIGLLERGEEGHWSWVDGTDFLTTPHFWDVGQPDEWEVPLYGEDCGQLHLNAQHGVTRWNDADCSLKHPYVCELKGK